MNGNRNFGLKMLLNSGIVFLFSIAPVYAAVNADNKSTVNTVGYEHIINWSLGLVIVLGLFFGCVWLMRKLGRLPHNGKQNMQVITALSLGMREKLVLVQVGKKQLILGVSPGKIDNLLLLEGDDQLFQESSEHQREDGFSDQLKQIMKRSADV